MNDEIVLFLSQFLLVFLLGFQSQCVRDGQYGNSALTSLLIGMSQLFQWRVMPNATPTQMIVWLCAGPLAIMASIWLHPKICKRRTVDKSK